MKAFSTRQLICLALIFLSMLIFQGRAFADMFGWEAYEECSNEKLAINLKQRYCSGDLQQAREQIRYVESRFEETKIKLENEIARLNKELDMAKEEKNRQEQSFYSQRTNLTSEIATLNSQIESLKEQITMVEKQMAQREKELARQIADRNKTIQILKKDSGHKEQSLLDDMQDLQNRYDADMMKAKIDLLAEQKQRVEALEAQRNDYELKLISLKAESDKEQNKLRVELSDLKRDIEFTTREQDKLLDLSQTMVTKLKDIVRNREAEISMLRRESQAEKSNQEAKYERLQIESEEQQKDQEEKFERLRTESEEQKRDQAERFERLKTESEEQQKDQAERFERLKTESEEQQRDQAEKIERLRRESLKQKQELERMLSQERELAEQLRSEIAKGEIRLKKLQGKLVINIDNRISFESGSAWLKTEIKSAISKIATILADYPENRIQIEGHTDNQPLISTGVFKDNWQLSTARALSVLRFILENEDLDKSRFTVVGYGEFNPIADNNTVEGRALNRRVDIVVAPRVDK